MKLNVESSRIGYFDPMVKIKPKQRDKIPAPNIVPTVSFILIYSVESATN